MKKFLSVNLFLALVFLFSNLIAHAKGETKDEKFATSSFPLERYTTDTIQSNFSIIFATNEDKNNFKKLREYLQTKETILSNIKDMVKKSGYDNTERNLKALKDKSDEITQKITKLKNEKDAANIDVYFPQYNLDYLESFNKIQFEELQKIIEGHIDKEKINLRKANCINLNIALIESEIAECKSQIDSALTPEYQSQEFRIQISYGFSALLGLLLIVFIVVILKAEKGFENTFFSDMGLQFITIFVLIIAIILFGILGVLEGRELSAILAGISGYILGKSVSSKPNDAGNGGGSENSGSQTKNKMEEQTPEVKPENK